MVGKVYVATKNCRSYDAIPIIPKGQFIKLDVTSANNKKDDRIPFSPMTILEEGYKGYINFEAYWQAGKVMEGISHEESNKWWRSIKEPERRYDEKKARGKKAPYKRKITHGIYDGVKMDYITSRKKVYVPEYYELIKNKDRIKYWKNELARGENIMIYDYDGPRIFENPLTKYKGATCLELTVDVLREKLNDPTFPFGHGYIVAATIAGILPNEYLGDDFQMVTKEKVPKLISGGEPKVETKVISKIKPKGEPKVDPKVISKIKPKGEPKIETKVETKDDSKKVLQKDSKNKFINKEMDNLENKKISVNIPLKETIKDAFKSIQAMEAVSFFIKHKLGTNLEGVNLMPIELSKGTFSDTFILEIFYAVHIICKCPLLVDQYDNKIENFEENLEIEHSIGKVLNSLRYEIPNFVFTIGITQIGINVNKHGEQSLSNKVLQKNDKFGNWKKLLLEYVKGSDTLGHLLSTGYIKVPDFIYIYVQILLALEMAQRKCEFFHRDLHSNNIMIKQLLHENYEYVVNLDCECFKFKTSLIPVIIDFGKSSVKDGDKYISINPDTDKVNHLIPSLDMYNLLIDILLDIHDDIIFGRGGNDLQNKINLRSIIFKMLSFLSDDFSSTETDTDAKIKELIFQLKNFTKNFESRFLKSEKVSTTPLKFMNWIITNFQVQCNKLENVKNDRKTLDTVIYDSNTNRMNYVFSKENILYKDFIATQTEQNIEFISKCIPKEYNSFIKSSYDLRTITKFSKIISEPVSQEIIKKYSYLNDMNDSKNIQNIKNDLKMLNRIDFAVYTKDIKDKLDTMWDVMREIKEYIKFYDEISQIYQSRIDDFEKDETIKLIEQYVDFYYLIQQLRLDRVKGYSTWFHVFSRSDYFENYKKIIKEYRSTQRWVKVLNSFAKDKNPNEIVQNLRMNKLILKNNF
jgi:hypothetical protein